MPKWEVSFVGGKQYSKKIDLEWTVTCTQILRLLWRKETFLHKTAAELAGEKKK